MKIKKNNTNKNAYQSEPNLLKSIEKNPAYVRIDLTKIYPDTCVLSIYIHRSCIFSVLDWVLENKAREPIPEIGGFVLGHYFEEENKGYNLSLERFIPSKNVAYKSPIQLEFGAQSLIELYEEKQKHPDLELIGWFHTHPGHTPYLSEQDLSIHNNFFNQKYHLAIVLDSLTEAYETVFISRKKDHSLNNYLDSKKWIKWKNLAV